MEVTRYSGKINNVSEKFHNRRLRWS